jgi:predicted ABC-type ATPase
LTASHKPRLLIVAGPNGSGKTTLTNRLRGMGLDFGEYINADEIALTLPASPTRDADAQQEANHRRTVCLAERSSFSFETVMSHESKIEEMRLAKAAGYEIMFIGVSLETPELNVARVALRVSEGGHDVPKDRIIARYERTMKLMPQAMMIADRSLIFDNTYSQIGPILALTTRLFEIAEGTKIVRTGIVLRRSTLVTNGTPGWVKRYLVDALKINCGKVGIELRHGEALPR